MKYEEMMSFPSGLWKNFVIRFHSTCDKTNYKRGGFIISFITKKRHQIQASYRLLFSTK